MNRRRLLATGLIGAGAFALPGCAATAIERAMPAFAGCLPPVKASRDRLIRAVAGLRPYRPSGFFVRAEPLGDKLVVHNYGHGGAGITLSWGTSKLAAALGLRGHAGPVAVIGAGIMGLTTARLVQEAGFPVRIYAAALPPETTSNVAGGQWSPYGHYRDGAVTEGWRARLAAALDYSWRRFQIMVGEDYGVRWLPTYFEPNGTPEPDPYTPGLRLLGPGEHPFPVANVARYDTLYVETGRFLRQLMKDVRTDGGAIEVRRFATPADIAALPERLVFNCTGLGARALFGDQELTPVRGQLAILLPQPEIGYAYTGSAGYMFPRPDGILLGGTFERGIWSTEPDPHDIARIVAAHRRLFGGFRCAA
ncbi:MAG: FAD-dependent oxidoreductase [Sphingomonadaceae bacterium]